MKIKFKDKEHQLFYQQCMEIVKNEDAFHQSLFYILGLDKDTRKHINDLYDFSTNSIKLNGINKGWQTSGSYNVTLFAFNLWNGYSRSKFPKHSTPYELFDCEYSVYFIEAIKIKYPIYFKEKNKNVIR